MYKFDTYAPPQLGKGLAPLNSGVSNRKGYHLNQNGVPMMSSSPTTNPASNNNANVVAQMLAANNNNGNNAPSPINQK